MGRILLLLLLVSCRQFFGFADPHLVPMDAPPSDTIDAPITCTTAGSCPESAPICLQPDGVCVECTAQDAARCTTTEPICAADNHCRGCVSPDECASGVCLPDGSCAASVDVAYVEAGGTSTTCTQLAPCASVNTAIVTGKSNIKLIGIVTETTSVVFTTGTISLFGPARLTRSNLGLIVDVQNQARIAMFDLTISGAISNDAIRHRGISLLLERVRLTNNERRGIDADVNSSLTMRRCIVAGNVEGGIEAQNVVLHISNSLFVGNGSLTSNVGGLRIKPNATSTFELNTIADNVSGDPSESGIRCDTPFALGSNIVVANLASSNCDFDHSLFDTTIRPGTGNVMGDPAFVNTNLADPTGSTFYRIGPTSDAIDGAASTIAIDIDGQLRGAPPDMGADEYAP